MEADFNATNKIVYGDRMMKNIRKYNLMPEETFSEKNRMADDGTLCKILFYDITRQVRVPAAVASVDASNCYDRIAHAIASLGLAIAAGELVELKAQPVARGKVGHELAVGMVRTNVDLHNGSTRHGHQLGDGWGGK